MPGVDGSIVIDTKVDKKGVKMGLRDLEASARRMAASVEGIGRKAEIALQKQVDSLSKLNSQYTRQKQKVDDLNKKVQEYASQKIPTDEYREIQEQIDKANVKLGALIDRQDKFLTMGGNKGSRTYKSMQYDIQELINTIKYAEGELADLEQRGNAFSFGAGTEAAKRDIEKLAAEQQKLQDVNNRLRTSYDSIEEKVDSYRRKLAQTNSVTDKAEKSTGKYGRSLKTIEKGAGGAQRGIGEMLAQSILFSVAFRAISAVTSGIAEGMTNFAQYSSGTNESISMLLSSFTRLKNAFATAFSPILSIIAPILAKFIDMLSTAASYVSMFFSILSGKGTYTRAVAVQQDYAASLNETAGAADNVANAMKKANKATNQYLSGLDEVRRFERPDQMTDIPVSGGAGNASGGLKPSDMFEEVPIDNKFGEYMKEMLKILEPTTEALKKLWNEGLSRLGDFAWDALKGFYDNFLVPVGKWTLGEGIPRLVNALNDGLMKINFDKIISALDRLWVALTPFAIRVGEGLVWLWENALVPLGTWVANEIVPRFLDTLSLAIAGLNNILGVLQPLFQWFWDSVLQPIAQWTGGIFLSLWDGINTALSAFSEWCAQNPGIVQNMAIVIGAFFAAFKVTQLVSGIANLITNLGGVFGAVSKLKTLISAVLNPWTLAITGIIAVGVLLYKNWDVIKEKAIEIWGAIRDWFEETTKKIKEFFADLWTGIKETFKNVGDWFKEKFDAAWKNVNDAWKGACDFFSDLWDGIKEAFADTKDWFTGIFQDAWNGITGVWESVVTWFSDNVTTPLNDLFEDVFNGLADIARTPINAIIGAFNGIIGLVNGLIGKINSIQFKITIPDWIPGIGGSWWGFDGFNIPTLGTIPYLASGAVIPPNAEFLAILGDQKNGRNLETPEALLRQIVREESGRQQGGGTRFIAQINRRTLFDEFIEEAKVRQQMTGRNPLELA